MCDAPSSSGRMREGCAACCLPAQPSAARRFGDGRRVIILGTKGRIRRRSRRRHAIEPRRAVSGDSISSAQREWQNLMRINGYIPQR